jgi:hypothetical protein
MNRLRLILVGVLFALQFVCSSFSIADDLPFCSNRIINEVTKRVGCTVGDARCWLTKGGFCMDYIQKQQPAKSKQWQPISADKVRRGDVAQFNSRPHYAYVESVIKDKNGKPVAINVSEYNYGTCWVDEQTMVTDKYNVVNRRSGIPLGTVDGGFLRPH